MAGNPQISTVTIPCLVIAFNHVQFIDYGQEKVIGKVLYVPCRDVLYDDVDSWAIPIKDSGIFTQLEFELKVKVDSNLSFINPPTFDSFSVFRIRDKNSYNEWMIYGTKDDFIKSCQTCCGSSAIAMPGTDPLFRLRSAPCQIIDLVNGAGVPYSIFSLPNLTGGEKYYPFGSYNNVQLPLADPNGYANKISLFSFLAINWGPFLWSDNNDILIATGGNIGDSLCVSVMPILGSA